jgi:hypothetical protein
MSHDFIAFIALSGSPLFAYVDPGIIGTLYQMVYVAIFGVVAAVIFKPWGFLKAQFLRLTGRKSAGPKAPDAPADPSRSPDDGTH